MDEEHQAGRRGLRYAYDKGLAVVVMEPLRGGQLTIDPPPPILELWDTAARQRAPADWALQWVWNQPQVSVVLSGMSTMEHVVQNVASANVSGPDTLSDAEQALIERVRDKYRELTPIPCTDCKYCLPCPEGVSIPRILRIYNEAVMYNTPDKARRFYSWIEEAARADQCVQCGECEEKCPQGISIIEWLERIHQALG
jgi:hypothetical protein